MGTHIHSDLLPPREILHMPPVWLQPTTQSHLEKFPGSTKDTVTTDEENNKIYADYHA